LIVLVVFNLETLFFGRNSKLIFLTFEQALRRRQSFFGCRFLEAKLEVSSIFSVKKSKENLKEEEKMRFEG